MEEVRRKPSKSRRFSMIALNQTAYGLKRGAGVHT